MDFTSPRAALMSLAISVTAPFLEVRLPFFNAPITVVGMAAAGAVMSFAFGPPEASRKKLFFVALAATFIGTCAVTVLPAAFGLAWVTPIVVPPLAFFLAFLTRYVVPLVLKLLPALGARYAGTAPAPQPPAGGQS